MGVNCYYYFFLRRQCFLCFGWLASGTYVRVHTTSSDNLRAPFPSVLAVCTYMLVLASFHGDVFFLCVFRLFCDHGAINHGEMSL